MIQKRPATSIRTLFYFRAAAGAIFMHIPGMANSSDGTGSRGNRIENYTRDGARVIEKDELGRAVKAERVVYRLKPGVREVIAVPSGEVLEYRYKDSEDRIGISSAVARD